MYGVVVWFEQVKCRLGPEMKQDLLQFSWSWRPGVAVDLLASRMWMFKVAVAISGLGVDANLRLMQVLKGAWRIVGRVASPNCARTSRGVEQFSWELAEGSGLRPKNLASTSFVAKLISQDVDGQIHCRQHTVSGNRCCLQHVRARKTFLDRRPVQSRAVVVQGRYLQLRSSSSSSVNLLEWLIEEIGVVEEMIRRKSPSAPIPPVAVPPGDGEVVPVAPVPPRVEVPFVAPVPSPVLLAEELVMQVEKFLRLQPPTYSGGPNPDTSEHWVHEIERVFATELYLGVCPRLLYFFSVLWKFRYVNCEIFIKCGVFLCVYTDCGLVSLARLRPVRGRRTRIKYVIGLTGLAEAFRHTTSRVPYQKVLRARPALGHTATHKLGPRKHPRQYR
ncbi:hypothetical protein Taro_013056 [Colocasia esculenta]|uniref:Uncharacterized protein n=1 Tax=Colocasia esculenta TaxID=4460 RepID=A0A843UEV7_COLES|nr:hypothetical protein [Colocasia esculenta]